MLVPVMNPAKWSSAQRRQQEVMAPFRAYELHRPAVRAASSGISMIVDADGRVRARRTQKEGPGYIAATVNLSGNGPYLLDSVTGDRPLWVSPTWASSSF